MKTEEKTRVEQSQNGWFLWTCEAGNQWATPNWVGGLVAMSEKDGHEQPCGFSGCHGTHSQQIFGHTEKREVASSWFKRVD